MRAVSINGRLVSEESAHIAWNDRGLLYGDGLFETMRVEDSCAAHVDRHLQRLASSSDFLEIPIPRRSSLVAWIDDLLAFHDIRSGALRITVTRGTGVGLASAPEGEAAVLMNMREQEIARVGECEDVGIARIFFHPPAIGRRIKTLNYLPAIVAQRELAVRGFREGIVLSEDGEMMEGTVSNLFAVVDGVVITPPVSCGILPGITRALVLEAALRCGINAQEMTVPMSALPQVSEMFYTNSVRGLVPIRAVETIWQARSHVVSDRLARELEDQPG